MTIRVSVDAAMTALLLALIASGVMMSRHVFAFLDFSEPALLFILDYLAVMGLFASLAYYGQPMRKR